MGFEPVLPKLVKWCVIAFRVVLLTCVYSYFPLCLCITIVSSNVLQFCFQLRLQDLLLYNECSSTTNNDYCIYIYVCVCRVWFIGDGITYSLLAIIKWMPYVSLDSFDQCFPLYILNLKMWKHVFKILPVYLAFTFSGVY